MPPDGVGQLQGAMEGPKKLHLAGDPGSVGQVPSERTGTMVKLHRTYRGWPNPSKNSFQNGALTNNLDIFGRSRSKIARNAMGKVLSSRSEMGVVHLTCDWENLGQ